MNALMITTEACENTRSNPGSSTKGNEMTAKEQFMANYAAILEQIDRLQSAANDHFGANPDRVDWSHAGSLGHIEEKLSEVLEFIAQ